MKVEAWVVLKATRSQWQNYKTGSPYAGQSKVDRIRVVKVAQNKPAVGDDEITMKVELDVAEEWFLDGIATIKGTLGPPAADTHEIDVAIDMPVRGRSKSAAAGAVTP